MTGIFALPGPGLEPADDFCQTIPMKLLGALRGFWDTSVYIYLKLAPERGAALLLAVGAFAYDALAGSGDESRASAYIGFFFLGVSCWQLLKELLETQNISKDKVPEFEKLVAAIKPSIEEQKDGHVVHCDPDLGRLALMSPDLNRALRDPAFVLPYDVAPEAGRRLMRHLRTRRDILALYLRQIWQGAYGRGFFNEQKLGAFSPIRIKSAKPVQIARVDYFSSVLTNEISLAHLVHRGDGDNYVVFDGTKYFPLTSVPGGAEMRTSEFGSYFSGNHVGASTIAITADKFLVFWLQANSAQQSVGMLAPTGSGSVDWTDVTQASGCLKQVAIAGLEREFHEESIKRDRRRRVSRIEETLMVGYFRNLRRGGKPEFVAISRLNVNHIELDANIAEVDKPTWGYRGHHFDSLAELSALVDHLLTDAESNKRLSVPLWMNLVALRQAIKEDPQRICDFCRIPL